MVPNLSTGAIMDIIKEVRVDHPVMQVLGSRKIASANNSDRYRLFISDGKYCASFAMLTTQLNFLIEQGLLEKFTVIRLNNYVLNVVNPEKRVLIILDLTVLASAQEVGEKIGDPIMVTGSPVPETNTSSSSAVESQNVNPNIGQKARAIVSPQKIVPPQGTFNRQRQESVPPIMSTPRNVHSIASLTPYQNKWIIRARVANKSTIRSWNNSRGEGTLFSMDLLDESGEIRCTGFKEQVDKFYSIFEPQKVYYISRASVKPANKMYSNLKHDYEMTLTQETVVEPCTDNTSEIPLVQFSFVPIASLQQVEKDSIIDVIGVCKSASDLQTLMSRTTNRELKKRELHLVDNSNMAVTLTLWGEQAETFDPSGNPVVAVKGAKVSDFGGRSLSTLMSSLLVLEPQIDEANVVRSWFQAEGHAREAPSISKGVGASGGFATNWKYLRDVHDNQECRDKPEYLTVKATVTLVKSDNCMYMACPTEDCNKKVIDMSNGTYRCEKCNNQFNRFKWRLLLSVVLSDCTDSLWVTCFQESAEAILGMSAQKLGELKDSDENEYQKALHGGDFKEFIFKLRTKMEVFQDEQRLKTTAVSVTPLDCIEYNKKLIEDLKKMMG